MLQNATALIVVLGAHTIVDVMELLGLQADVVVQETDGHLADAAIATVAANNRQDKYIKKVS